jgi:hypothetical protein
MSVTVAYACRKLRIGAAEKSVLMRLADYADDDGTRVYPSAGTISVECCLSYRTVLRCFGRLEALGVLKLQGLRGGGRGNTNHYTIDLARVKELITTGPPYNQMPTRQIKSDTASPINEAGTHFINGETADITTITAQKSPNTGQIKSDTASPIRVSVQPPKGDNAEEAQLEKRDTVSIKGDTVSPDSSLLKKVLTVPPAPPSASDILWALLPALMQISGQKERAVGGLIRSWRDKYGAALVIDVLNAALENPPDKPIPWIIAALAYRQRTAGGPVKLRIIPGGADDPRWRNRVAYFRDGGQWDGMWGPEPGQPGCQAPHELMAEILKEGAA